MLSKQRDEINEVFFCLGMKICPKRRVRQFALPRNLSGPSHSNDFLHERKFYNESDKKDLIAYGVKPNVVNHSKETKEVVRENNDLESEKIFCYPPNEDLTSRSRDNSEDKKPIVKSKLKKTPQKPGKRRKKKLQPGK